MAGDESLIYISAVYNNDNGQIITIMGTIGVPLSEELSSNGIGPLNLEKIKESGTPVDAV
jgi:hypothetical protein